MNKISVQSPVDGSIFAEVEYATHMQIEYVLKKAKAAQTQWRTVNLEDRKTLCQSMVNHLLKNVNEIAPEISWQMGRPLRFSPFEIESGLKERSEYMIDIATSSLQDLRSEEISGFNRFIQREPIGVVFIIAPWNYPYLTAINSIIPAILAGNVVVLKHSAQTPLCAHRFDDACREAGFPEGVFQYLHLSHHDTARVIQDNRVDFVSFTGSVHGGKDIISANANQIKGIGLELGGKDPAYVRPDVHLEFAIENIADGTFFNSGQSCCGIERIYVHESVYQPFVDGLVDMTKKYVLGDPLNLGTTLGPLAKLSAADYVRDQLLQAQEKGAKALIDPDSFERNEAGTPYLAPQILTNVDHSMSIMKNESFGPVVGVMKVKNDEEAVQLMNDSEFGLTASIWTEDEEDAIRLGKQLETGTVYMNRCDYLDPSLAWTGVKHSGLGQTLSSLGYDQLTQPKSFHLRTKVE